MDKPIWKSIGLNLAIWSHKNLQKNTKMAVSQNAFFQSVHHLNSYNFGYDKYFSMIPFVAIFLAKMGPKNFGGLTQKSGSISICGI